ncbi:hypothetical protein BGW37DRAFT_23776 [Umbelopsis sp. PMI_123]|nr:hypothetical protein BGW37DRAFT_23776 [Umbelopsis sp. PMI_123]
MEHSCFWALLSHGDLNFIYLPLSMTARHRFFGKTFFDFVHPEEAVFARQDLSNFMHAHTLGGSVTRCRLKNVNDMQPPNAKDKLLSIGDTWLIVDVIMYVVTESLILAFFHCDTDGSDPRLQSKSQLRCGDYDYGMTEAENTKQTLRHHDVHSNVYQYSKLANPASQRIFQILDNRTKQLLISWPEPHDSPPNSAICQVNYNKNVIASLFNTRAKSDATMMNDSDTQDNGFSCIQKTCTSSCTSFQCDNTLKTVERVLITYGNIMFGLFQLSDSLSTKPIASNGQNQTMSMHLNGSRDDRLQVPNLSASTMILPPDPPNNTTGTSLLLPNNHSKSSTCTESYPYQPSHPIDKIVSQQARSPRRHYIGGSDTLSSPHPITQNSSQSMPTNLLIPYARRICNFPQLSPVSEPMSTARNDQPRPSESYFRSSQPKNIFSAHTCESCGTDTSPEWRRGPSGHKTLCNACGLRYSRSLARQTKATQQREERPPDSVEIHKRLSQKRPSQEEDLVILSPYLRQSRFQLRSPDERPTNTALGLILESDSFQGSKRLSSPPRSKA